MLLSCLNLGYVRSGVGRQAMAMPNYLNEWMDQLRRQPAGAVREIRENAPEAGGRHCQLLRNQSSLWASRGYQWQHTHTHQSWPRRPEPVVSPAESQRDGRNEHRIYRSSQQEESRVKWHVLTNSRSEAFSICRALTHHGHSWRRKTGFLDPNEASPQTDEMYC
jgi:hypothetical protein